MEGVVAEEGVEECGALAAVKAIEVEVAPVHAGEQGDKGRLVLRETGAGVETCAGHEASFGHIEEVARTIGVDAGCDTGVV